MCLTSLRSSRGSSGSLLTKRSVRRMTPELEAAAELASPAGAARDLDAAAADVDDDRRVAAADADAVDGRQVDEPRFLGARR